MKKWGAVATGAAWALLTSAGLLADQYRYPMINTSGWDAPAVDIPVTRERKRRNRLQASGHGAGAPVRPLAGMASLPPFEEDAAPGLAVGIRGATISTSLRPDYASNFVDGVRGGTYGVGASYQFSGCGGGLAITTDLSTGWTSETLDLGGDLGRTATSLNETDLRVGLEYDLLRGGFTPYIGTGADVLWDDVKTRSSDLGQEANTQWSSLGVYGAVGLKFKWRDWSILVGYSTTTAASAQPIRLPEDGTYATMRRGGAWALSVDYHLSSTYNTSSTSMGGGLRRGLGAAWQF